MVVEQLKQEGILFAFGNCGDAPDECWAQFRGDGVNAVAEAVGATRPICLAALKAKGVEA
jgi:hypothetical protein